MFSMAPSFSCFYISFIAVISFLSHFFVYFAILIFAFYFTIPPFSEVILFAKKLIGYNIYISTFIQPPVVVVPAINSNFPCVCVLC